MRGNGFNHSRGGGQMIMRGGFNSRGRGFPRGGGFNSGGFRGNGMLNGRGGDRGDRGGRGRFPPNQGSNHGPPAPVPQPVVVSQEPVPEKTIPSVTPSNNVVVTGNQNQGPPPSNNNSMASPMSRGSPRGARGTYVPRGGISRGRGNFASSQGPPRQQFDTRQPSNTTTVTPINKRGGYNNGGTPGPPKRGN